MQIGKGGANGKTTCPTFDTGDGDQACLEMPSIKSIKRKRGMEVNTTKKIESTVGGVEVIAAGTDIISLKQS